ncbi:putative transposase [Pseudidiomarina planktonica]|uniref:Putative transposase n=1 Tax=Pseudidiomarina planktonica TaxID=1323738 RepID=A0A1Y6EAA9_9GAMM|nr:Mu transposase C-terminal domain-containing protein [Pseudidiomarina planktonica]RUO66245.1 transposase [Pseudidiomarina planktonica]SMQ59419.1 putative transposase [Pseudidiomarina planktonica]
MTDLHKLSKSKVQLRRGSLLKMDDGDYLLKEFLTSSEVLLQKVDDKDVKVAKLQDIVTDVIQAAPSEHLASDEILAIPPDELKAAKRKFKAIEPILELGPTASVQDIKIQAVKSGVHYTTLYRWLNAYLATNSLVSLINQKRGWQRKNIRTSDDVNKIIEHCIANYYLTKARFTPKMVYDRIKEACKSAGLKAPAQSTIYRRINLVPEERRLRSRGHLDLANNRFSARAGRFPNVDSILSVIQVDHTPLDIIIVDDEHRESIKRVWLTMAIDIYSRMVTGFYLSLDAPSTTSVAMCLSHSILPKQQWLKHLDIALDWYVWGIPKKVHVDNGADFTSDALRIGCLENNINLEFRPVAKPQYGGHIERLLGAFQNRLKALDGKTFNSPKVRGSYDSEKNAIFDFNSLERWLTNAIIEYHHTNHESIGVPPTTKWMMSVEGELEELPHGWPDVPADPLSIEISFLPYKERTIRSQGVVWDGIYYFSDNIRHLIGIRDQETRKPRKYVVRRDPRNIRYVWVYDEDIKSYHKVGLADPTLNFTSIWELNEAKLYLKKKGQSEYNQNMLSRAVNNMREIEEKARKKTKDARRKTQRKKNHQKTITPAQHFAAKEESNAISTEISPEQEVDDWDSGDEIDIFDIE